MDGHRTPGEAVYRLTEGPDGRGLVNAVIVESHHCGGDTWVYTTRDTVTGEVWTGLHVYDADDLALFSDH